MTSSARARIEGGTVRASAFAVLRLMTSSKVVGCWTGRSAGFSPGNLRAVQLLLGHKKIESTVRYLGIEVDDALAIAEQVDVCLKYPGRADLRCPSVYVRVVPQPDIRWVSRRTTT